MTINWQAHEIRLKDRQALVQELIQQHDFQDYSCHGESEIQSFISTLEEDIQNKTLQLQEFKVSSF